MIVSGEASSPESQPPTPPSSTRRLQSLTYQDAIFVESQPPVPSQFASPLSVFTGTKVTIRGSSCSPKTLWPEGLKLAESQVPSPPPSLAHPEPSLGKSVLLPEEIHKKKQALDETRFCLFMEERKLETKRRRLAVKIGNALKNLQNRGGP